jgi:hypothetical protein
VPSLRAQVSAPAVQRDAAKRVSAYSVPRTPWGDPDLQGVWSSDEEAGVPFERPMGQTKAKVNGTELEALLEEREHRRADSAPTIGGVTGAGPVHWYENWGRKSARTSLVIDPADGHVPPLTAKAQKRHDSRARAGGSFGSGPFEQPEDFSLYDRCITRGLPSVMFPAIYNNNTRIVQAPGYVAITYEMIHETRVIPLDGRPHLDEDVDQFTGNGRGRWEGDTLVVETRGFNDRMSLGGGPHSKNLRTTERIRRVDPEMIEYRITVEDPETYTAPFTVRTMWTTQPNYYVYEYSCHEGNFAISGGLSGERAFEKQVAEAQAAGLPIPRRSSSAEVYRDPAEDAEVFNINRGE